jgi:hypothetical protein
MPVHARDRLQAGAVRVIVLAGLAIHRHNRSVADGFQHCEEVQVELMDLQRD